MSDEDKKEIKSDIYEAVSDLLNLATCYGFDKNLWHCYISFILAMSETPFALVAEKSENLDGSVVLLVKEDLKIFKAIYDYDFSWVEEKLGINCFSIISDYKAVKKSENVYNKSVSEKVRFLTEEFDKAENVDDMYKSLTSFYRSYGVGTLGLNSAFRINDKKDVIEEDLLIPITSIGNMTLDSLIGYEDQKKRLVDNTESFLNGEPCNNVLLYGDAGTGKSTSIKALLNMYYDKGLRMIEVYKHEFKYLNKIISKIKDRNYKFIIFMDDLSFEEFEIEYKYLKALIEGGLETKPKNVLIYATSNRRHLIRETWSDRSDMSDDELHRSDTMQEKLSLVARFGVSIGYFKPNHKEFLNIVEGLYDKQGDKSLTKEELLAEASKWELRSGGASGRTAQQFINSL